LIGSPSKEDIDSISNEKWKDWLRKAKKRKPKDFKLFFPHADDQSLDLLKNLLIFNPKNRITVQDALNHPYLEDLHIPDDEPTREPINPLEFEFEKYRLNSHQY
jgi:serine/threonine protein kinase